MAKQESPVRISPTLLAQAQAAAETFSRKLPDQISYWANIGRLVESKLSGDELSALFAGIGEIKVSVEQAYGTNPAEGVASTLSVVELAMSNQNSAAFKGSSDFIATKSPKIRYEAVPGSLGVLRKILPDGSTEVGTFKNGKFRKLAKSTMASLA